METYFEILKRRKWVIILTTFAACAVVSVGTYLIPPTYLASTTLRVAQTYGGLTEIDYVHYMYAERLMNTYAEILRSRPILEEAIQRLELGMMPGELAKRVKVEALANTELIRVSVEDGNPWRAKDIANMLATLLMEQGQNLYSGGSKSAREILQEQLEVMESNLEQDRATLRSLMNSDTSPQGEIDALSNKIMLEEETYAMLLRQYEEARVAEAMRASSVTVVEPASEPEAPSWRRKSLNVMLGVLVGLVGGTGLALLFENLDTTLYTMEQVRAITGLPILGRIPAVKIDGFRGQGGTAIYTNGDSSQAEAYRLLRTNILSLGHDRALTTLLTTSAERGEGKTTVVANLAQAMAQAGRLVVAVDADLRLPTLHHVFELPNEVGLSSVLEQRTPLEKALQNVGIPGLQVLTSGPVPSDPMRLLGTPEMAALLETLTRAFHMVLLDTPSLLGVADAAVLAPLVDGVAVVVALAQARQGAVQAAIKQSLDIEGKVVGIIVNRAEHSGPYYPKAPRRKEADRHGSGRRFLSSFLGHLRSVVRRLSSLLKGKTKSSGNATHETLEEAE